MVRPAERTGLSPQEYLEWERGQTERHEFVSGEVFAISGGQCPPQRARG